jgi:catechol 2,3-dioxygenase-like lactoylglutathione lyase family enzyme
MNHLPALQVLSVKIPVTDLTASRLWYADVFGLREEMEWPDADGAVRGVTLSGIGDVLLALREHPEAAAATHGFGFLNVQVAAEDDLANCAAHLDGLGVRHTAVMTGASGRRVGFQDLDGHELSFYARTITDGVRTHAVRPVRAASPTSPAPTSP